MESRGSCTRTISYGDQVSPVTDRGDHADSDPAWVSPAVWNAAFDAQAKENLTAAADAAQSIRDNTGSFLSASATQMYEALPALSYNQSGAASTGDSVMSIDAEDGVWAAAALSRDGTCFLIKIAEGVGRTYGSSLTCTGSAAEAQAVDPAWPDA